MAPIGALLLMTEWYLLLWKKSLARSVELPRGNPLFLFFHFLFFLLLIDSLRKQLQATCAASSRSSSEVLLSIVPEHNSIARSTFCRVLFGGLLMAFMLTGRLLCTIAMLLFALSRWR